MPLARTSSMSVSIHTWRRVSTTSAGSQQLHKTEKLNLETFFQMQPSLEPSRGKRIASALDSHYMHARAMWARSSGSVQYNMKVCGFRVAQRYSIN
jgi:hypothetical protein